MRKIDSHMADVLVGAALAGFILIVFGVWLVSAPAAVIVAGVLLLVAVAVFLLALGEEEV